MITNKELWLIAVNELISVNYGSDRVAEDLFNDEDIQRVFEAYPDPEEGFDALMREDAKRMEDDFYEDQWLDSRYEEMYDIEW